MSALGLRSLDYCRPPVVDISGQTVIVDISGQTVNISGQTVDISGQTVIIDISGQTVDISGQTVIIDISGQTVDISGQAVIVDISGQRVDISGQCVCVDISGQRVDISGQAVIVDISGQCVCVDISGQTVNISGQTVDISGQAVIVDISGQKVDITGQTVVLSPDTQVVLNTANPTGDAFGRLRASNPYTLFEFNSILGKGDISSGQAIIDEQVSGIGASSVHVPGGSYVEMSVTTSPNFVIRQSHEYILYQPGKSKLIYMTGVLHTSDTSNNGIITRIGAFDVSMGVYFEYNDGNYNVVIRNGGSGFETRVNRSAWNGDKLLDISFNYAQIYTFDIEWLGVGQVRCGIVSGGITRYYHTFTHINELLAPYIMSAKLPLRYSIQSTRPGASGKMRMICGTVISEGGISPPGIRFIYPTGLASTYITGIPSGIIVPYWDTLNNQTYIPLLSLRLKTTYPERLATIKIKNIDIFSTDTTKIGSWRLILNGDVSGGTFIDYDNTHSASQVCFHQNISGTPLLNHSYTQGTGVVLYQNYFSGRSNSTFFSSIDEMLVAPPITVNLNNISDRITLVANSLSNNSIQIYGHIEWIELM